MVSDVCTESVRIDAAGASLDGELAVVRDARAVVLFAHGTGSSRRSPRNRYVARALNDAGFATLLMDLLTAQEEDLDFRTRELRFDIARLAARLTGAIDWLGENAGTAELPVLLYGASTGAAGALISATERCDRVRGVISRGGRPDLADNALHRLTTPTLLIVGGNDPMVGQLNRQAAASIEAAGGEVELVVVPGASHLFEEPGALDTVVTATVDRLRRWTQLPEG